MTTTLRPIFGHSEQFLINEKKFFPEHWTETIALSLHNGENTAATNIREATAPELSIE